MPEMTKAQREKADKVAGKILKRAFELADEEYVMKEGGDSSFVDYERGSYCTFRRGDVEYIVMVESRRAPS